MQYRGATGLSDFGRSTQLAATYRRLITAKPFLERVAQDDSHPFTEAQLRSMISASTESNPPVINIRARHMDPVLAASGAQVIAEEFIDYAIELQLAEIARLQRVATAQGITNVQEISAAQFAAVDSLSLLEPVVVPGSPVTPRTRQNILMGAILGTVLAGALAIALESMKDTVRFPEEVTRRFGVASLGTIFKWPTSEIDPGSLVLWDAPSSGYAEAFRQIRANLQFAAASSPGNTILVSSPAPGEGKSTVVANLALAIAQSGRRIVVVDGDLRRPSIHTFFSGVEREPGLSNYLAELEPDLSAVTYSGVVDGVQVIPSGPTPPNPAELLGSPRMSGLLAQLSKEFDTVLVDSPPLLPVSDGTVLAAQLDSALLVVDAYGTRTGSLDASLDGLKNVKIHLLGVVINKLKRRRFGYGYPYPYYQYYYSYKEYYAQQDEPGVNGTRHFFERFREKAIAAWPRKRKTDR